MARLWLFLAALLGATAVAVGAMTAHDDFGDKLAAKGLDEPTILKRLDQVDVAVRYNLTHALAMLGAGLLAWTSRSVFAHFSALAFLVGTALFSGTLYAIVFLERPDLTMIVPFGGGTLIGGWVLLALGGLIAGKRFTPIKRHDDDSDDERPPRQRVRRLSPEERDFAARSAAAATRKELEPIRLDD